MATIHISGADAARDFAGLMAKVRAGAEVVIEDGTYPPAVLRSAVPAPRTITESIEIARKLRLETGESPVLDADFAEDVAEIHRGHRSAVNPESRRIGFMAGRGDVGPEFFDPLPEDELRLWNCEEDDPTP
jgi:antitoxin (DNA-binding transcriptional repressor) of toxin-antitoxin stability system